MRVSDTPKIQMDDLTVDHHLIYLPENSFRIPLLLWGIFSYFPSIKPTAANTKENEEIYLLTPSLWNPHDDAYAGNEENMLDWECNMIEKKT